MSRRGRGRKPSTSAHHTVMVRAAAEVDLMMECVDEELSPWQLQANRRAQTEYNAAVERIKRAQAGNLQIVSGPAANNVAEDDVIVLDDDPEYRPASSRRRSKQKQPTPSKQRAQVSQQQFVYQPLPGKTGQQILIPHQYPAATQRPIGVVSPQGNQNTRGRNQKKGDTRSNKNIAGAKLSVAQGKKHAPTFYTPDAKTSSKSQEFGSPVQKHQKVYPNVLKLKLSKTSSLDGGKRQWVSQNVYSDDDFYYDDDYVDDDYEDTKLSGYINNTGVSPAPCSVVVNKFTEASMEHNLSNVDIIPVRRLKQSQDVDYKLSPRKGYVFVGTSGKALTPVKSAKPTGLELRGENRAFTTRSGKEFSNIKDIDLLLRTRRGTVISKPQSFDFAKKKLVNAKVNLAAKRGNQVTDEPDTESVTPRSTRRSGVGEELLSLDNLPKVQSKRSRLSKIEDQQVANTPKSFKEDIQQVKREMEEKIEQERTKYEQLMKKMEVNQKSEIERLMMAVKQSNKNTRSLFGTEANKKKSPVKSEIERLMDAVKQSDKNTKSLFGKNPVSKESNVAVVKKVQKPAQRRSEISMLQEIQGKHTAIVDSKDIQTSGVKTRHFRDRRPSSGSQKTVRSKLIPTKSKLSKVSHRFRMKTGKGLITTQKTLSKRPTKFRKSSRPVSSDRKHHSNEKTILKSRVLQPRTTSSSNRSVVPKAKKLHPLAGPKTATRKRESAQGSVKLQKKRLKIDPMAYLFDDPQLSMDLVIELNRCSGASVQPVSDFGSNIAPNFPSVMVIGTIERVEVDSSEMVLQPGQIKVEPIDSGNTSEIVSGTYGLGIKRTAADSVTAPAAKKGRGPRSAGQQIVDAGAWVPLDEYYYGKKEGDPAYREEKGEFRFKCWYCHKMLYNNLRIMMHVQGHIDTEKRQKLDLSDITQCKHCFKQFDTPFEMQCHVEKIHQNKCNVLVCRICEKDHDSQANLRNHMRNCHTSCEMPYICQLCNFRSSVYSDVVDHFKKRHDSSHYLMCLYCLKAFKVNFSKEHGWGLTQNYYQHLQRHQIKNITKKCTACKLTYLNKQDAKIHKQKDHMANYKGTKTSGSSLSTTNPNRERVMIKLLDTANLKPNQPKSLNAPVTSKVKELRGLKFWLGLEGDDIRCAECKSVMSSPDHFKKYVECSMCRYATTCSHSYISHMMGFHAGNATVRKEIAPTEKKMPDIMYCLCGYSSIYGNSMANHMVRCSKRTSYKDAPQQKIIEYDDEQEDFDPFAPDVEEPDEPEAEAIPSTAGNEMFLGIFGLMKKPSKGNRSRSSVVELELTPQQIAESIVEEVLDVVFPAEAAAGEFLTSLLHRIEQELTPKDVLPVLEPPPLSPEDIPEDLKGEQKWSTVEIKEKNTPSKSSIFGSLDEDEDVSRDGMKDDDDEKMDSEPRVETNFRAQHVEDIDDGDDAGDTGDSKDDVNSREETPEGKEEETEGMEVEEKSEATQIVSNENKIKEPEGHLEESALALDGEGSLKTVDKSEAAEVYGDSEAKTGGADAPTTDCTDEQKSKSVELHGEGTSETCANNVHTSETTTLDELAADKIDVPSFEDSMEDDPGTPTVDEPMDTAEPTNSTEGAEERKEATQEEEHVAPALENVDIPAATSGDDSQAESQAHSNDNTESEQNNQTDQVESSEKQDGSATDHSITNKQDSSEEITDKSARESEQESHVVQETTENTSKGDLKAPEPAAPEKADPEKTAPEPAAPIPAGPEEGSAPLPTETEPVGCVPSTPVDQQLPAVPPLIPNAPAETSNKPEESSSKSGYSERRDDSRDDYRRSDSYSRSDSDRDRDRDRDRDYHRSRDRDHYRRDDRGYHDRDRGYHDRDRGYDRRDNYNRDRHGGYHSSRDRYDDYNRHGSGGYGRHDSRHGSSGGGYHRDNRDNRRGSGGSSSSGHHRGYY